ncbi:MAG: Dabb family protein [Acidimicrobiia bacterium]|nr:Dabb family protein [Acidimicrobiia bacterium]
MLRHIVLFKWKPETPPEVIAAIEAAMNALPGQIPQIAGYEWGTDVSVQGLSQGFTHCFVVSFRSEADRDIYATHPDHVAFLTLSKPHRDVVMTFDYFARRAEGSMLD